MSVQRGVVYPLVGASPDLFGVLVVTNDTWNRKMDDVGVIPLRAPFREETPLAPIVFQEPMLQAVPGHLGTFSRARLGPTRLVLNQSQLARVEDALCDLLLLRQLCGPRPTRPRLLPGLVTYPRWSEVYYIAGQQFAGERKRYVVVSRDDWNRADETAIAVRTTSQTHRYGHVFPPIERGRAKACCADTAAFTGRRFDYRHRPDPAFLSIEDMVAIAGGLVQAFELEDALSREPA